MGVLAVKWERYTNVLRRSFTAILVKVHSTLSTNQCAITINFNTIIYRCRCRERGVSEGLPSSVLPELSSKVISRSSSDRTTVELSYSTVHSPFILHAALALSLDVNPGMPVYSSRPWSNRVAVCHCRSMQCHIVVQCYSNSTMRQDMRAPVA